MTKKILANYIFIFIITFFVSLLFGIIGVDFHHHGIMFHGAMAGISDQFKLYKDVYFHYGPLTAFIQTISLFIFGKKLISLHILTSIFYGIISIQLFNLNRVFFNNLISSVIVIIWVCLAPYFIWESIPWSSVYIIPFYFLIFSELLKSKPNYFLIGIYIGIIFAFRQSSGIITTLAVTSLYIIELKNRAFYKVFLGIFLVIGILLVFLWINGNLIDYIKLCFIGQQGMVIKGHGIINQVYNIFSTFFNCVFNDNWIIFVKPHKIPYLPYFFNILILSFILISIISILRIVFKNKKSKLNFWIIIISCSSLSQIYPIPCTRHYYWAITPIIPFISFGLFVFYNLIRKQNKLISLFLKYFFLTILTSNILIRVEIGLRRFLDPDMKSRNFKNSKILDGIMMGSDEFKFISEIEHLKNKKIVLNPLLTSTPYLIPHLIENNKGIIDKNSYILFDSSMPPALIKLDSCDNKYRSFGTYSPLDKILYISSN